MKVRVTGMERRVYTRKHNFEEKEERVSGELCAVKCEGQKICKGSAGNNAN